MQPLKQLSSKKFAIEYHIRESSATCDKQIWLEDGKKERKTYIIAILFLEFDTVI